MNTKMVLTQVKRELWENKVSFINTPIVVSLLILVMAVVATVYSSKFIYRHSDNFSFNATYSSEGASVTTTQKSEDKGGNVDQSQKSPRSHNIITSVGSDPTAFNGFVLGVMYANCVLLFLIFSIVLCAYSLRCLFDDRKNKDILFWRSMPVSETTNVLVKLAMVLLIAPTIVLVLNFIVTVVVFFLALIYLAFNGIKLGYLISSVVQGGAFYIPFQVFYELLFSLLMLMPVIGFAFFASAFAKKTPFFTFASPLVLVLVDRILNSVLGMNIGFVDLLSVYGRAISNVRAAFVLQESFAFQSSMVLPFILCVGIGAAFIAGSIWLRNNRYEI